jgi:hypothetical protein
MPMKFALRIRVQLGLLLDAKPKHVGVAMTRREPTQHFLWSMPTGTSRLHLSAPEPSIDDVACACNLYFSNQVEFTSSSPQFVLLLPFPKLDAAWRNTDSPGPGAMPCQPPPKAEKTDSASDSAGQKPHCSLSRRSTFTGGTRFQREKGGRR